MPLKDFFKKQIDLLLEFMEAPDQPVRVVLYDSDIKQILMKVLARLEEEEDNDHLMLVTQIPFHAGRQFCPEVLAEISQANEQHRSELAEVGVELPALPEEDSETPLRDLVKYVSDVADRLPEAIGSYVLIMDPEEVTDGEGFKGVVLHLAEHTTSDRAKFLILDDRRRALLADVDTLTERAGSQTFYMSPEEIEKQVRDDLEGGKSLSPGEKRQYTAMLGAFASSNQRLDEAEKHQKDAVRMADEDGSPAEQANACYNLGNTYSKQGLAEPALECFHRAVQICLEAEINPLLAMALTNLGITLYSLRKTDQALETIDAARNTFDGINNKPGEAYALDCKAHILALIGRRDEAEQTWLEALAVYEGITSNVMEDVREAGSKQIIEKLKNFYEFTGQKSKLENLRT
ncbi:MAG: tetratricopeptide repeat protein [bacterium]|nr:tetratricopeptide repeat protein [bacterium]